ncbi:DUF2127 domain-containing protein [Calidifontibacter terrae]
MTTKTDVGHRWELRSCGRHGHLTYAPTDTPDLADRLRVTTAQGEAWRCLRCGSYVVGAPVGQGPEDDAPIPLRGKALRDAFIMRFLAIERFGRGLLLFLLAYGVWKFNGARDSLHRVFNDYLPAVKQVTDKLGIDLYDSFPVRMANKAFSTGHHTLQLVVFGVIAYGLIECLEGVGLWVMKRWGEYVAVIGTSIFLPYEIYDLIEKFTVLRVGTFLLNLAAVVWLVWSKRLFGVRGGKEAYEAQRHSASILEIERAALQQG